MSADAVTQSASRLPRFAQGASGICLNLLLLGGVLWGVGVVVDPTRAAFAWLTAFAWGATLLLGLLLFLALQHLTGATWSVVIRRFGENVLAGTPWLLLLFVPVAVFATQLFPAMGHHPVGGAKGIWLSLPFVLVRSVLYLGIWTWMARTMRGPHAGRRAGLFVVLAFLTTTFATMDWLMALDPHWYSTLFGPYVYGQGFVAAIAVLCVLTVTLGRGPAKGFIRARQRHDLAKWLFAMAVFWGYLAFSQWFLIWYGNIPEETGWMLYRWSGGFQALTVVMVLLLFGIPFVVLMTAFNKRLAPLLGGVAALIVFGHYLGMYWLVMPAYGTFQPAGLWLDAGALLAVAGGLGLAAAKAFAVRGAVPHDDPDLAIAMRPDEEEDEAAELEGGLA
ncbi:MAG: hypothetical protein QNJ98_02450 [Planctomycetota bacterium]|nr:hypothetical protein [Planctomycetota bacterium]